MKKRIGFLFLAAALAGAGGVSAQVRSGFIIGVMVPQVHIGGSDFSGDNYFDLGSEIILIPRLDPAWGWGIMAGIGAAEFDLEVYFLHAAPKAQLLFDSTTASFGAIGLNGRWYPLKPGVLRPYLNFAIDFSFLTVPQAAIVPYPSYREGDASFLGLGLTGGIGLAVSPIDRLTLFCGGEFRWNPMGKVKGITGGYETTKDLDSSGFGLRAGTVFRF